ncbi:MAG: phosphoribosylglycinamide formyltransferase [Negativicutes bacterium]
MRKRIAVLVSGGGTNLQALIDAANISAVNAEIVTVIADNPAAYALERAMQYGITAQYISKSELGELLTAKLLDLQIDLVVLAGFLSILPADTVAAFRNRIINIHPSLIPKFCGKGFYGEKVHAAVLAAGETISGATTHFVDEGVDTGKIIMQRTVPVQPDDTVTTLQQRVLVAEHEILLDTVRQLCKE